MRFFSVLVLAVGASALPRYHAFEDSGLKGSGHGDNARSNETSIFSTHKPRNVTVNSIERRNSTASDQERRYIVLKDPKWKNATASPKEERNDTLSTSKPRNATVDTHERRNLTLKTYDPVKALKAQDKFFFRDPRWKNATANPKEARMVHIDPEEIRNATLTADRANDFVKILKAGVEDDAARDALVKAAQARDAKLYHRHERRDVTNATTDANNRIKHLLSKQVRVPRNMHERFTVALDDEDAREALLDSALNRTASLLSHWGKRDGTNHTTDVYRSIMARLTKPGQFASVVPEMLKSGLNDELREAIANSDQGSNATANSRERRYAALMVPKWRNDTDSSIERRNVTLQTNERRNATIGGKKSSTSTLQARDSAVKPDKSKYKVDEASENIYQKALLAVLEKIMEDQEADNFKQFVEDDNNDGEKKEEEPSPAESKDDTEAPKHCGCSKSYDNPHPNDCDCPGPCPCQPVEERPENQQEVNPEVKQTKPQLEKVEPKPEEEPQPKKCDTAGLQPNPNKPQGRPLVPACQNYVKLGDCLFCDANNNGIQDANEVCTPKAHPQKCDDDDDDDDEDDCDCKYYDDEDDDDDEDDRKAPFNPFREPPFDKIFKPKNWPSFQAPKNFELPQDLQAPKSCSKNGGPCNEAEDTEVGDRLIKNLMEKQL